MEDGYTFAMKIIIIILLILMKINIIGFPKIF